MEGRYASANMNSGEITSSRFESLLSGSLSLSELASSDVRTRSLVEDAAPLPGREGYLDIARSIVEAEGAPGLRLEKRRRLAAIAARDLNGELPFEDVSCALSDLADACLAATLESLGAPKGFVVIAMGKLGGRELNYASDIDLTFATDGDIAEATRLAAALVRELGQPSPQGQAFRIDLSLRPEGKSGALVRSTTAFVEYYKRWAKPWEYQALIKARTTAGDRATGTLLLAALEPVVYSHETSPERIAEIRRMKERVESHASRRSGSNHAADVKHGAGGIRDIEFSVQLLQLVHGGTDPSVRSPTTLDALTRLEQGAYIAEEDGMALSDAYRWLRTVEHRVQLWQERQVHTLPRDSVGVTRIARTMGFGDSPEAGADTQFESFHNATLAGVRGRFEKLFYRPMIESLVDPHGPGLSEEAMNDRLRVLGFRDVERAARTLNGLVSGSSRRARELRVLTPPLLQRLANTPLPDEGLMGFLRLSETLESQPVVLGKLRDNPPGIAFLADVLGSGRALADVLMHVPEELTTIAAGFVGGARAGAPKKSDTLSRDTLVREAAASLSWRDSSGRLDGLRRFKRRKLLDVALRDLGGEYDVASVGKGLSNLAEACLEVALEQEPSGFAVIGMGKLGGRELNYSSDIDIMFVHDSVTEEPGTLASQLLQAIGEVTPEGKTFAVDMALRPEGKNGPLSRSLESCLEYYERWARPWEHQVLIKARVVAGDPKLGDSFVSATRPFAFPAQLGRGAESEIRHLKARMERERIPRGTDPRRHIKLGPGGTVDVEFAVQMLQLEHGHHEEELRVPGTVAALEAAARAELLGEVEASWLIEAHEFLARVRNRLFFMTGRAVDSLPIRPEDLEALGVALGFTDQPRQELEEIYLRITRRARRVAERLIYGD